PAAGRGPIHRAIEEKALRSAKHSPSRMNIPSDVQSPQKAAISRGAKKRSSLRKRFALPGEELVSASRTRRPPSRRRSISLVFRRVAFSRRFLDARGRWPLYSGPALRNASSLVALAADWQIVERNKCWNLNRSTSISNAARI